MKLTSLFKKAATVLCALALVGMLAACSNGSSSSSDNNGSGNGSGSAKKGEYKIMYDGILLMDGGTEEDLDETKQMFSDDEYDISGKTMTLTDAGFDTFLDLMGQMEKDKKIYVAIVVYNKEMIMPVTQAEYDMAASKLTEGTDYTVTHNGKVIELTDAGYTNGAALFAGSHGSGNDDDDDTENVTSEYKVMYDGIEIFWNMKESKFNSIKNNLSSSSYTINGKTMTLNDKGFDELLEFMSEDSKYTYVAIIVYMKKCVTGLPSEFVDMFKDELEAGTDYTVTHNGKVYELTNSGMEKFETSFGKN